jgi:purine-binding chemotaxis protein CheW
MLYNEYNFSIGLKFQTENADCGDKAGFNSWDAERLQPEVKPPLGKWADWISSGLRRNVMETAIMDQAVRAAADREGKYLTFALAGEEYGIGILKVKEIIGLMAITTVPRTPDYVKGVINLRGKVIPVADLRLKFGMESMAYTDRTCIIVVEISGAERTILMGIVVDSVSEVLNIKAADIEDTPNFGSRLNTAFILGMAKINGAVKILLDIDRIFRAEELNGMPQAS